MSPEITVTSKNSANGAIKVAFATNDSENIDAHFGSAKQFYIYTVTQEGSQISNIINIQTKDTDKTVELLKNVDIVYFINIGPTAAAKIINSGIFPIKYKEIVSIESELDKLQTMLGTNPPPFIKKIITQKAA